jgi:membrane-bound serine protease (ClpP class)
VEITDPTLVFLLITLGLVGIGVEVLTPGGFFPAIAGIVAMVLGVIGFIQIDAPSGGIGLLLVAIAFFIAAAALKRYTALSVAGTAFLVLSGIFMFDRSTDPTSIPVVVIAGLVLGGFMMFVIERAGKARSRPVMTGWEELLGMTGEVRSGQVTQGPGTGQVFIDGALWRARLAPGSPPVNIGDHVRVEEVDGLTLVVRSSESGEAASSESDTETEGAV